jgi:O-antigen/teichoic acid export membrane protein
LPDAGQYLPLKMARMLQKIKSSEFVRNVFRLLAGNSAAQAINILISPWLTRLYAPEAFGVFALFMATLTLSATLTTGKYETAILLPRRDRHAWQLLILSFLLTIAGALLLWLTGNGLLQFFPGNSWLGLLYWVAPGTFLTAGILIFSSWLTRKKQFLEISKAKIVQAITTALVSLGLGYVQTSLLNGLIWGALAGQLAGFTYLLYINRKAIRQLPIHRKVFVAISRKYLDFPAFALFSEGVGAAARELPNYLIALFYGERILGYYNLALRVLQLPKIILSLTIGEVYVQKATELSHSQGNRLRGLTDQLMLFLLLAGLLTLLPVIFWGEAMFSFAFGKAWVPSAQMANYFIPWMVVWFASSPLAYIFYVKRKLQLLLVFQTFSLITRFILFISLAEQLGHETFLFVYGWSNAALELILLIAIREVAAKKGFDQAGLKT